MESKLNLYPQASAMSAAAQFVRQLPKATALIDKELKVVAVSVEWSRLFSNEPKIKLPKFSKLFKNESKNWSDFLVDCITKAKRHTHRAQLNCSSRAWADIIMQPWYDEDENIFGALITVEEVTDYVSLESMNQKLNLLLEETSQISRVGMWEFDFIQNQLSWSKMTKKIHEVPEDFQPEVDTAIDFYKEGHSRNTISMCIQNAFNKGEPFNELLQIVTVKGKELWVRSAGKPIFEGKKLIKLIGTFQDVDEQVKIDMKIRENEKLLQTIIDNLPLNLYIKDTESRKILVNKSECEFFGAYHPKDLLGKNNEDLFDSETAKRLTNEDLHVIKNDVSILGKEEVIRTKKGDEITFLVSKMPLKDTYGSITGLMGISIDISSMKNKETELKNLINVTALQNKKLLNFAHIVSHNLRSHSANFSMLLNFFIKEKNASEKEQITKMLVKASDNLMTTLDDLNQVVDISTNFNLDKQEIDLIEKLNKVKEDLTTYLNQNNAIVRNKIPKDTKVFAVHAYLESVLLNLLTNAVKYQHPKRFPEVILSIEQEKDHTILLVQDNGLGIDLKKNGDQLFGMYKTFHGNKDARGMGLYITKNQMEAMGGFIKVESKVGEGTIFKLYFNEK